VIVLSSKTGRKRKDNPKDYMLRTRLDNETLDKLNYTAEKLNISCSELVRRGIEAEYLKALKK
jgi:hypothetical protein